ncbi:MAG: sigma-54 dependent transcriptional regulator [Deltaproteobacteria bacterium]|jgi:DNA-binding NtrC family response regulator|nr:sigma-54 dependent transcriptional regulator [Deltaproteobacteria bacterium]
MPGAKKSVLIIDDEENIRRYLGISLSQEGYEVHTAQSGKEGLALLLEKEVDIVVLDLHLPDSSGLDILRRIKNIDVDAVVIIITAYGDIGSAVEATKRGAYDYLTKPFEAEDVKTVINKALRVADLEDHVKLLRRQVDRYQYGELIARSKKMRDLIQFGEQIAQTPSTVIIYGETGTGKELIANLIHKKSPRAGKPFVTIDCTSLPENLLESELFGHERGAFTGAVGLKKGLFEVANGGTVFLDEIGEIPVIIQAKILRVLESQTFRRVGGEKYIPTDVRIISATNRDLKKFVQEKRFRSDLYYRLNVVPIHLPPLRERREDIFPLIEYFVQLMNKKIGRRISTVSNEALKPLIEYDWPGNIRELRNIIEHMAITTDGPSITTKHLPVEIKGLQPGFGLPEANNGSSMEAETSLPDFKEAKKALIENFEKDYIRKLLEIHGGNVSRSAREIGTQRSSLQRLMRKYGIDKA